MSVVDWPSYSFARRWLVFKRNRSWAPFFELEKKMIKSVAAALEPVERKVMSRDKERTTEATVATKTGTTDNTGPATTAHPLSAMTAANTSSASLDSFFTAQYQMNPTLTPPGTQRSKLRFSHFEALTPWLRNALQQSSPQGSISLETLVLRKPLVEVFGQCWHALAVNVHGPLQTLTPFLKLWCILQSVISSQINLMYFCYFPSNHQLLPQSEAPGTSRLLWPEKRRRDGKVEGSTQQHLPIQYPQSYPLTLLVSTYLILHQPLCKMDAATELIEAYGTATCHSSRFNSTFCSWVANLTIVVSLNPMLDYLMKMIVIGESNAGKSCLLHHFINESCKCRQYLNPQLLDFITSCARSALNGIGWVNP